MYDMRLSRAIGICCSRATGCEPGGLRACRRLRRRNRAASLDSLRRVAYKLEEYAPGIWVSKSYFVEKTRAADVSLDRGLGRLCRFMLSILLLDGPRAGTLCAPATAHPDVRVGTLSIPV